jgi:hypothetical protein
LTGPEGSQGPKGDEGKEGKDGPQGLKGDTGATGSQGPKGDTGATGPQGSKGEKGDTGATGSQGLKGDKGDTGATGSQGLKGEKGDKGDTGTTGAAGASRMLISGLTNESGSSSSARYLGAFLTSGPSATEPPVQQVVPVAGTVSNLSVRLGSTPNNGSGTQKYTFSVRKNGSNSGAISCEISENESTCSSSTQLSFAAGDLISLQATPSGTPSGWTTLRWAVTLTE